MKYSLADLVAARKWLKAERKDISECLRESIHDPDEPITHMARMQQLDTGIDFLEDAICERVGVMLEGLDDAHN